MGEDRNNYGKRTSAQSDDGENGESKRRTPLDDRDRYGHSTEETETVYRYLCPGRKIGSIIGKGGEIAKQLRTESQSKIRIGESVPGSEERVVTIYSSSHETNKFEDTGDTVCPAHDALFKVHYRVVAEDLFHSDEENEDGIQVSARLLVPSDQIGCIIGKGGQIIQGIRIDTGAQIRILKDENLPLCAMNTDELLQISGEPSVVRKALFQVACRLHDNPSKSHHLLISNTTNIYQSQITGSNAPVLGIAPMVGGDWSSHAYYPGSRDERSAKQFNIRLLCSAGNIGAVIGKGGSIIKQIRLDSGATIKVDSSTAEDDCIISIAAKEMFEDPISPVIDAAVRLQPRCSEKTEKEPGDSPYMTRLLVPSSRIGCLVGKGGSIISDMRKSTRANIHILSKEHLPNVASEDEEMVQISGEPAIAKNALVQVTTRLRANFFDKEGVLPPFFSLPPPSYLPISDGLDGSKYGSRDSRGQGRDYSSYSGYSNCNVHHSDNHKGYVDSKASGSGAYGGYTSGRSSSTGAPTHNASDSHGRHHGY